ncbi:tRNA pseudouridine(38-40) synthase TruA [Natranaeroarchaeum aerophilus]|uniref:tRNA pseudouridine synthase A n=1 Tax=Natranaeroarchaeum aerophilus TaxID=2917711 RepID=A0AAE3FQ07_9EURY|nr:tRNA pseudouridine(38-40) synthase TruA [Natranaeroarchaeum aerophilus]MCL9813532.1 tRNA pseudouridine(38-40) synthase TruA [Natranaeroarchaeum aerophilus]
MRAYRIAYDGRGYYGFQRQPDVPTVEDAIFDALRALDVFAGEKPSGYAAAGRTDAGVSALAQTVAFEAPDWLSPAALNSELPADVRAWASADVPDGFHATHHATERRYTYHLHAPEADAALAREALERLSGRHDFHNLTPDDDGTVRRLDTALTRDDPFFVLTVSAGGFARQLVRRLVSLVAAVARGERPLADVERVLAEEPLDGPRGVAPAPAQPLVLAAVTYGPSDALAAGIDFDVDTEAAESARQVFEATRVEQVTSGRVAAQLLAGVDAAIDD